MKALPFDPRHRLLFPMLMSIWTGMANGQTAPSLMEQAKQWFKPLPQDMSTADYPTSPDKVALGRELFFDPRISSDGTVSCATCHRPALYGTDALPKSIGVEHRPNARNAPTVLNAALQFNAHWIGDRNNVEDQAAKALTGRNSFGNQDVAAAAQRIKQVPGYEFKFKQAFPNDPDPVTPENWGRAIGAFERTLVTPSPFDAYLQGDTNALPAKAQEGLQTFIDLGCASCHGGIGLGGSSFEKFGILGDYWKETGSQSIDEGRLSQTKNPSDKSVFKVPMLRNVAMTPPYFHDGSVAALPEAVRIMGKLQLGKDLSAEQIAAVVAFLGNLTGRLPDSFATEPVLPPQGFQATSP